MKTTIEKKLFTTLETLKSKVKEADFNQELYEWKVNTSQRFKDIAKSWRNICKSYRKYFDSHEEYVLDLNLFDFELRTMETQFILKHQYGADATKETIFELVVETREPAREIAIKIINSLKYEIYETN